MEARWSFLWCGPKKKQSTDFGEAAAASRWGKGPLIESKAFCLIFGNSVERTGGV